jgi:hypothetical protein
VTALITGEGDKKLVDITVDTDRDGGHATGTITATDNHPFWVEDFGGWIDAGNLHPGDLLRTSSGTYVQITAIRTLNRTQTRPQPHLRRHPHVPCTRRRHTGAGPQLQRCRPCRGRKWNGRVNKRIQVGIRSSRRRRCRRARIQPLRDELARCRVHVAEW